MNDSLAREVSNSQFKGRNDIVRINGMSRTNSLDNHGFDLGSLRVSFNVEDGRSRGTMVCNRCLVCVRERDA